MLANGGQYKSLKKMKNLFLFLLLISLFSCTDNQRARNFGGTEHVKMPPNHKFINLSWKQDDLWIVSQDTTTNIIYCWEKSSFGIMEGEIVIDK